MTKNNEEDSLKSRLDEYFCARISEENLERLNQELLDSSAARIEFWERASLEEALECWGRRRRGEANAIAETMAETMAEIPLRRPLWSQWPAISGWAAAIIVLALLFSQVPRNVPDGEGGIVSESNGEQQSAGVGVSKNRLAVKKGYPVAFLSEMVGVTSESRYFEGQSLGAGEEIQFSEGLMEITLYSGARVSVEGPARFVPNSDLEIAVSEGSVEAEVPESAIGFQVLLPDGLITDFGTKFDFKVSESKSSRVQVLEGEIELVGSEAGNVAQRMFRGDAVSMNDSGRPEAVEFQPLAVNRSLKEKSDHEAKAGMSRWMEACRLVDADESVVIHFSLLSEEQGSSVIKNHAQKTTIPKSGSVISAAWSEGRWPGKPALAFRRPPDRVRVDIPGEFPQATFIVWARIDGLPRPYNGLFYSEYHIDGEAHWQLDSEGGFLFGVRPRDTPAVSRFDRAKSQPVISPWEFGSWRMLATTYDSESREVTHFMDGEEVSRTRISNSIPLRFGRATLGNFFDPDAAVHGQRSDIDQSWSYRNWTGAIDEFILYSRVLKSEELFNLYEAGRVD